MGEKAFPYKVLGIKLKKLREAAKETLAEVSGAVEIDIQKLMNIEAGREQPSEDILLLLISHFDVEDREAVGLWEIAGYGLPDEGAIDGGKQPVVMIMPFDNRILYSDNAAVDSNENGVVVSFLQSTGNQKLPVSRVGMSREQAEKLLLLLTHTLKQKRSQTPKLLPPQNQTRD